MLNKYIAINILINIFLNILPEQQHLTLVGLHKDMVSCQKEKCASLSNMLVYIKMKHGNNLRQADSSNLSNANNSLSRMKFVGIR